MCEMSNEKKRKREEEIVHFMATVLKIILVCGY